MDNKKRPSEPSEAERWAQEIQLTQLDKQFLCKINGMPIQNVKSYSLIQSSGGHALLNLTLEINAEVVSTMIQAPMQSRL